jgi:hypothetical protein
MISKGNPKVLVGFKCSAELKDAMQQEANILGITLSEYTENICALRSAIEEKHWIRKKKPQRRIKQCLETGQDFVEGYGYPRQSKTNPELIDCFLNSSAWTSYLNKHKMRGIQIHKENALRKKKKKQSKWCIFFFPK